MDLLPLHIEYLLTRHDCVIVPGIGAFIATETEAAIDFEHGVISPRRREVSFNSSVVTDDGLLSHSIARSEHLSYEEAHRMLSHLTDKMKADLRDEGEVSIGMVGRLIKDQEGLVSFLPRVSASLSDINGDIKIKAHEIASATLQDAPTQQTKAEQTDETEEDGTRIIRVAPDRYVFTVSKRAAHVAAMLITIFTIGISLLIPINHDGEQKASVISVEGFFHQSVNRDFPKADDNAADTVALACDSIQESGIVDLSK